MKSYILWDHDGVLVETERWYFEATRQSIREIGVDLDKGEYLQDMAEGRSAWDRARARGAGEDQVRHGKHLRDMKYQQYLVEQDITIPGVAEVLAQLSANYAMAIVTTATWSDINLIHRDRQIVRHMEFVLAQGDYLRSKPAPDPYLEALRRFAAAPHEAVVIEDSERGLRAAVAAGIDCVVVANEFVRGQDFSAATYCLESVRELPRLLASLA
jgi:HAD superfamily hydrolase (TIGR01509 family)